MCSRKEALVEVVLFLLYMLFEALIAAYKDKELVTSAL